MASLWKSTRLCVWNATRLCRFRRRVASLQNHDPNSHSLRVIWLEEVWAATVCQPLVDVVTRLPRIFSDRWLIGQCFADGSPDWFTNCPLPAHPPCDPPFLVGLLLCCTKHGSPDWFIHCRAEGQRGWMPGQNRNKSHEFALNEWSNSQIDVSQATMCQPLVDVVTRLPRNPFWQVTHLLKILNLNGEYLLKKAVTSKRHGNYGQGGWDQTEAL